MQITELAHHHLCIGKYDGNHDKKLRIEISFVQFDYDKAVGISTRKEM